MCAADSFYGRFEILLNIQNFAPVEVVIHLIHSYTSLILTFKFYYGLRSLNIFYDKWWINLMTLFLIHSSDKEISLKQ